MIELLPIRSCHPANPVYPSSRGFPYNFTHAENVADGG
jgi:hypothetical protein